MEVVAKVTSSGAALPYLAKAAQHDTSGGLLTLDDICHDVQYMAVEADGVVVGAYAVKLVQHAKGSVLWLQSCAANVEGKSVSAQIINIVEQQARHLGASQVAFTTVRRGLMRKMSLLGYAPSGTTFRKNLK